MSVDRVRRSPVADCNNVARAVATLRDMRITSAELLQTLDYCGEHGGYCDCEILLKVAGR